MSDHINDAYRASFIAFWIFLGAETTQVYKKKDTKAFFTRALPVSCISSVVGYGFGYFLSQMHDKFPMLTKVVSNSFVLFTLGNWVSNICDLFEFKRNIESQKVIDDLSSQTVTDDSNSQKVTDDLSQHEDNSDQQEDNSDQ